MASIPIGRTVGASFGRVFGHLGQVFAVGLPYVVLQFLLGVIGGLILPGALFSLVGLVLLPAFLLGQLLIYTAMLVAWHRVTLLGYAADKDKGVFRVGVSGREWRFLGYSLLVYVLFLVLGLVWYAVGSISNGLGWAVGLAGFAFIIYLMVRCSLVLPATAAGHPTSLKMAWQQSAGHFWPTFIVLLIVVLISLFALIAVAFLVVSLFGGLGFGGNILLQIAVLPIQLLMIFVSVSALSYNYRCLSGHPDPLAETP